MGKGKSGVEVPKTKTNLIRSSRKIAEGQQKLGSQFGVIQRRMLEILIASFSRIMGYTSRLFDRIDFGI